ncbi:DMT family transporter [Desulfobaculum bizertense]|uniref:Permease of the drug/metabolite transporter (DMT) superfamily n=1 Tax=Desulfobaculum bizertense DSM 18034 TaxID=1121442 RepID=A0A1T4VJC7_9BACT|nr:DMT family transporter [Desulfobaculum bizertense]UIJ37952.1 DMT family transporter [Desulfobaculum bizertense]SKA64968.1 Permease of the drug/metabolite transporter (DMT) superfamily [Desulfobaculum bizertense DSM 18034]
MARGLLYAFISAFCFGLLPVLSKLAFGCGMTTFEILQYRFGFGALCLAVYFAIARPQLFRISREGLIKSLLVGAVFFPMQSTGFVGAVKYIPASTTALIIYGYPALTAIASAILFKQPLTKNITTSLVLIFSGCALVFCDAFLHSADYRGVLLAVSSMLGIALNFIIGQLLLKGENAQSVTFYVLLSSAIAYFAANTYLSGAPSNPLDLSSRALIISFSVGLISTTLAILFMYMAIEKVGSTYTSIFSCFEPVTSVFFSWVLLSEPLAAWQLAGAALIIGGIIWPNKKLLSKPIPPREAHSS